jgi:hypothetical protein
LSSSFLVCLSSPAAVKVHIPRDDLVVVLADELYRRKEDPLVVFKSDLDDEP